MNKPSPTYITNLYTSPYLTVTRTLHHFAVGDSAARNSRGTLAGGEAESAHSSLRATPNPFATPYANISVRRIGKDIPGHIRTCHHIITGVFTGKLTISHLHTCVGNKCQQFITLVLLLLLEVVIFEGKGGLSKATSKTPTEGWVSRIPAPLAIG